MKPLSKVLTDTKPTAEQTIQSNDLSNMRAHGSITKAGKMNTPLQSKQADSKKANHNEQGRQQYEGLCLKDDIEAQKNLAIILADCFDALNLYGKEPEQLESIIRIFKLVLGKFTWVEIERAFGVYLTNADKMPTPADIIKIIEPPKQERKWCGATFIDIKRRKRENQFITPDEEKYCSEFIAARIKAPEEERGLIDDALQQVEQQNKQYWLEG